MVIFHCYVSSPEGIQNLKFTKVEMKIHCWIIMSDENGHKWAISRQTWKNMFQLDCLGFSTILQIHQLYGPSPRILRKEPRIIFSSVQWLGADHSSLRDKTLTVRFVRTVYVSLCTYMSTYKVNINIICSNSPIPTSHGIIYNYT